MTKSFTDTVAQGMVKANPELKRAPAHRMQEKVRKSVRAFLLAALSLALLAGGCYLSWGFAASAIAQKQAVGVGLMMSLLVPLIPGVFVGGWALLRFDSDAGGVFKQLITLIGAASTAIRGKPPVQ